MRKYKLADQAARRMRGLELKKQPELPNAGTGAAEPENCPEQKEQEEFRIVWRTDTGLVRKNNQDAVILGEGLMGVADGMGGHNGGEIASAGARDGMIRMARERRMDREALEEAVCAVNLELFEQQEADPSLSGMGTTLTVLAPDGGEMLVAQVGDSRAYLMRDGEFRQVTEDHSMVADMVRKGILTEEEAARHPMRNYITRAVGTEDTIDVDLFTFARRKGDRWLICSDGLHGLVSREELKRLISLEDLDEAADQMMRDALENGGRDNITLVIAEDRRETEAENE